MESKRVSQIRPVQVSEREADKVGVDQSEFEFPTQAELQLEAAPLTAWILVFELSKIVQPLR